MKSGLGLIIMPLAILLLLRKDSGPVSKFLKAGATTPDSARRPASLNIVRHFLVADAVKSGRLVALDDGRYYVNLPVHRRARRNGIIVSAVLALGVFGLGLWLLSPWDAS